MKTLKNYLDVISGQYGTNSHEIIFLSVFLSFDTHHTKTFYILILEQADHATERASTSCTRPQ